MTQPAYTHGASATPLLGETIGQNLRRTVERVPDGEALVAVHQDFRCTYRELWAHTSRAAKALIACGVDKGARVGVWSPNRFEWVILQYATARIGAILVNVNPAYKASELRYALGQSGVSVLVMSAGFRTTNYEAIFASVAADCPSVEQVYVLDRDWDALLAKAEGVDDQTLAAREALAQFDDPINIQYTSGTTGAPKGATLSHHNILNNGYFCAQILRYTAADRVCIPVPFYHCFGMVIGNMACTTTGATIVVPAEAFDPEATLRAVEAERCTSLYGVPTMFIAALDHPRFEAFDCSSLRTGVMAGSPCPIEVMKQVQSRMHMGEVTIAYGMTETSPVSTQSRTDDPLDKRVSTVGSIHPHVEIKIIDPETGATLAREQQGELCTRGYSVMLGYWNDPRATAEAIDAGGWMHTGDLATMDAEGYVKITGRIKDMICRGGENIYPREIEEYLYTHPEIADVQVIGVPSEKYVEEVMAWIKPKPGASPSPAQLVAFCKGQISTFKIPAHWKFVDEFPMTVTGKIQKYRMREIAIDELGLHEIETA
ncbi:AMP-binding protein [Pseudenhygromyxa sp. WMMC2535]|uniref:AMP-binding protein n=1 Tax=Pseudenhygromyxa sp. WMMC2535 TaxID=2712867 RepID=UPI001555C87C|nr:AMP-binding protein [Pseudenhygromyxa sp. WMMC2535]NVB39509.1 AMP-binding protein [Pseudenhygromyxa sp. WMMC2535]